MTAQLITRFKDITPDGAILEMVIWKVPEPVPPTDHGYKYRAVYVVSGIRFQGTLDLNCPASVGRLSMMHSLKMKGGGFKSETQHLQPCKVSRCKQAHRTTNNFNPKTA